MKAPKFLDPAKAGELYKLDYEALQAEAEQYARDNSIRKSATDKKKVNLTIIDNQITFCNPKWGELYVGGRSGNAAVEDSARIASFICKNLGDITSISLTLDTHTEMQIFHALFWVNDKGEHPNGKFCPFIELADVKSGKWKPNPAVAVAVGNKNYVDLQRYVEHYCSQLEKDGKYKLTIWPYHGMLGGVGYAIVPLVEEAVRFHSFARCARIDFQLKGGSPLTENYSVFRPEVLTDHNGNAVGHRNAVFIKQLLENDMVIFAGQAKSHCVAWSIRDLLTEIKAVDPALAKKVCLLEDCTSPVVVKDVQGNTIVDFTDAADAEFESFRKAGMKIVKSTVPLANW